MGTENKPEALLARIYCHDCKQEHNRLVILGLPECCPCHRQLKLIDVVPTPAEQEDLFK